MTKEEIRTLWVKALRSGEYLQTDNQLKDSEGFCCLGVLCDLVQFEVCGHWDGDEFVSVDDGENRCSLPLSVMDLVGIRDSEGGFKKRDGALSLMNDEGNSFEEIADFIENHPDEIFVDEAQ